jgi:hypothetical protein
MNWFGFNLDSFLAVFVLLNIVNVILQTVKSIATVKCGKWGASIMNAVAYALYTVVVVYMNADGLGIIWKAVIIGLANLVGVYVVKYFEEKNRKDKLWKVEATIPNDGVVAVDSELAKIGIPHNWLPTSGNYSIFNIYCVTQKESHNVREILNRHHAKYFVSESKTL